MAEEKAKPLGYIKLTNGLGNLKKFRRCSLLSRDQRSSIREQIDLIEDITRSVTTKVTSLQEEYQELKSHKAVVESEEKMKKLLVDMDKEIKAAIDKFKEGPKFEPVSIGDLFKKSDSDDNDTKNEKAAYWPLFVELEGVFLTADDDGGESKKGGGNT